MFYNMNCCLYAIRLALIAVMCSPHFQKFSAFKNLSKKYFLKKFGNVMKSKKLKIVYVRLTNYKMTINLSYAEFF